MSTIPTILVLVSHWFDFFYLFPNHPIPERSAHQPTIAPAVCQTSPVGAKPRDVPVVGTLGNEKINLFL